MPRHSEFLGPHLLSPSRRDRESAPGPQGWLGDGTELFNTRGRHRLRKAEAQRRTGESKPGVEGGGTQNDSETTARAAGDGHVVQRQNITQTPWPCTRVCHAVPASHPCYRPGSGGGGRRSHSGLPSSPVLSGTSPVSVPTAFPTWLTPAHPAYPRLGITAVTCLLQLLTPAILSPAGRSRSALHYSTAKPPLPYLSSPTAFLSLGARLEGCSRHWVGQINQYSGSTEYQGLPEGASAALEPGDSEVKCQVSFRKTLSFPT